MECPKCKLTNAPGVEVCECGCNFSTDPPQKTSDLKFMWKTLGPIAVILLLMFVVGPRIWRMFMAVDISEITLRHSYCGQTVVIKGTVSGGASSETYTLQDETSGIDVRPLKEGLPHRGASLKIRAIVQCDTLLMGSIIASATEVSRSEQ